MNDRIFFMHINILWKQLWWYLFVKSCNCPQQLWMLFRFWRAWHILLAGYCLYVTFTPYGKKRPQISIWFECRFHVGLGDMPPNFTKHMMQLHKMADWVAEQGTEIKMGALCDNPQELRPSSSPIVLARTQSISKMVKTIPIPHNDLPPEQLSYKLTSFMAITAYSKILHHPNWPLRYAH